MQLHGLTVGEEAYINNTCGTFTDLQKNVHILGVRGTCKISAPFLCENITVQIMTEVK